MNQNDEDNSYSKYYREEIDIVSHLESFNLSGRYHRYNPKKIDQILFEVEGFILNHEIKIQEQQLAELETEVSILTYKNLEEIQEKLDTFIQTGELSDLEIELGIHIPNSNTSNNSYSFHKIYFHKQVHKKFFYIIDI